MLFLGWTRQGKSSSNFKQPRMIQTLKVQIRFKSQVLFGSKFKVQVEVQRSHFKLFLSTVQSSNPNSKMHNLDAAAKVKIFEFLFPGRGQGPPFHHAV